MASDDYIKKLAPEGKLPKITEIDVLCRVAAILLDTTPGANRKPPRVGAGRLEEMPLPAHLQERLKEFAETQARPITDVALIERVRTEATKWINAIHMQARRVEHPLVNPDEPGDEVWRQEIDLHFLLVALTRLRRAVGLVTRVQPLQRTLLERLVDFDDTLPGLAKLRNAAEHFDDYTTELRHTAGTLAAQTGATTKELMARLGHSSTRAAMIYQHTSAERDRRIAERLGAMVDQERSRVREAITEPHPARGARVGHDGPSSAPRLAPETRKTAPDQGGFPWSEPVSIR